MAALLVLSMLAIGVASALAQPKKNQTITFTSTAPTSATVGGASYEVTATGGGSGNPVTFAINGSSSSVCAISGSTVRFIGAGTCTIDANQAGGFNYNAAPEAKQSFAVGKGSQTIAFTSSAPTSATVGGPPYTVTAKGGGSGEAVTFAIDSSSSSVCSISGSTVSFIGAGTCTIDANQGGNANYNAAPEAKQSVAVGKGSQAIGFTSSAPTSATVGGASYEPTATGGASGNLVTFVIDGSSSSVCSLSGATVTFKAVGTCTIDANQAGDSNYNAAPEVKQSFAVGKGAQVITFTSTAPTAATVGGTSYAVSAAASSALPVAFTIEPSSSSMCSISGSTVSFVGAGTCTIDANQGGDSNYNAAPEVKQSFAVGKGSQVITFVSTAPSAATVGGASYEVTGTGGASGEPVTFVTDESSSSVCSLSGATVTFKAVGTCTIDANQAGNSNYNAAPEAKQGFAVGKGSQSITFTSTAPASATVGGGSYEVAATGGASGNPVSFAIDGSSSSVCSVSGATVSFIGVGTCKVDANQTGSSNYNPAPEARQSFAVGKGSQVITFTSTAPNAATAGGVTYDVSAEATSKQPVSFTIDSSSSAVCSLSGSAVSFIGAGTCTIDANQSGDSNYTAAPQAKQSFAVAKKAQTVEFTSSAPGSATIGGPTYAVTAVASSGLEVVLSIAASSSGVCTISGSGSGSTVSFIGSGTCVIDVNQPGNEEWEAATEPAPQSIPVGKKAQSLAFTSSAPGSAAIGATYEVTAVASSGLEVVLSIAASSSGVCTISGSGSGSTVSFIGSGTCVIDVNQPGNEEWEAATEPAPQSIPVGKKAQSLAFTSTPPGSARVGGPTYAVSAAASSGLTVVLTIDPSSGSVCSLSGSAVSFIGAGTCTIDANHPGNTEYAPAQQVQQSFAVGAAPTIVVVTPPTPTPTPKPAPVIKPDSNFTAVAAAYNAATDGITFTESVSDPGAFSWLFTFQNGKFGVFAASKAKSSKAKCKKGFVRLLGKCFPARIVFATGSQVVSSAGKVGFTVKPSASAYKALKNAFKKKSGLPVTAVITFQSSLGGSPVSHTMSLIFKLTKA